MTVYYRPIVQTDRSRPAGAFAVAAGWCWFSYAERLQRGRKPEIVPASEVPAEILEAITSGRSSAANLSMDVPRLMGILNVTPDSFSDGGQFDQFESATAHALAMLDAGVDIIDVGGESTRPGAETISGVREVARTRPVIAAIRNLSDVPISIDTRKADVAVAAIEAGASIVNDISALGFDAQLGDVAAKYNVPICLMHAQGSPESMQDKPEYDDVLLDVYDQLSARIDFAQARGISRSNIFVDPGIGFGKTAKHNLALIRGIALFHSLGCTILLGTSRKRFIGTLAAEPDAERRMPGTIATALAGITQGVQITRVHDIAEMRQALTLWSAVTGRGQHE